jgi:hypothetical protein
MKYKLADAIYRFDRSTGIPLLLKAKRVDAPGQLSMFDTPADGGELIPMDAIAPAASASTSSSGSRHAPKGGGYFVNTKTGESQWFKGGAFIPAEFSGEAAGQGAAKPSGRMDEGAIAKNVVAREKSNGHSRMSKESAAYHGLDHKHPATHWDDGTEGYFGEMMAAYQKGGDSAVGKAFAASLDFHDEAGWHTGNALAKNEFNSADWESLKGFVGSLQRNPKASIPGGSPATTMLAQYLQDRWETETEGAGSGDKEDEAEAAAFISRMTEIVSSEDGIKQWLLKEGVARLDKDESGIAVKLAQAGLQSLDLDKVGGAIAQNLKLSEALQREQETGHKGGVITPWEKTEAARDAKAMKIFEGKVDWESGGMNARELASQPEGSKSAAKGSDSATALAVGLVEKLLAVKESAWLVGDRLRESLLNDRYDPAHVLKLAITQNARKLPEIREFVESLSR